MIARDQYSHPSPLQLFFKRHEKQVNSAKRKQKDAKHREIFEKTFPEVKKIREDMEQSQREASKADDGHGKCALCYQKCTYVSLLITHAH